MNLKRNIMHNFKSPVHATIKYILEILKTKTFDISFFLCKKWVTNDIIQSM